MLTAETLPSITLPSTSQFVALAEQQATVRDEDAKNNFDELQFPFKTAKEVTALIHQNSADKLSLLNWLMVLTNEDQWANVSDTQAHSYSKTIMKYVFANRSLHSLLANIVLRQHESKIEWAQADLSDAFNEQPMLAKSNIRIIQLLIKRELTTIAHQIRNSRASVKDYFYTKTLFIGKVTQSQCVMECSALNERLNEEPVAMWFIKILEEIQDNTIVFCINKLRQKVSRPEHLHEQLIKWIKLNLHHDKQNELNLGRGSRRFLAHITQMFSYDAFYEALRYRKGLSPELRNLMPRVEFDIVDFFMFYSNHIKSARVYLPTENAEIISFFKHKAIHHLMINTNIQDIPFGVFQVGNLTIGCLLRSYFQVANIKGVEDVFKQAGIPINKRNQIFVFDHNETIHNSLLGSSASSGLEALSTMLSKSHESTFQISIAEHWPLFLQQKLAKQFKININQRTTKPFFGQTVTNSEVEKPSDIHNIEYCADFLNNNQRLVNKSERTNTDSNGEFINMPIWHDGNTSHSIQSLNDEEMVFYAAVQDGVNRYSKATFERQCFRLLYKNADIKKQLIDVIVFTNDGKSLFYKSQRNIFYAVYRYKKTGDLYFYFSGKVTAEIAKSVITSNSATQEQLATSARYFKGIVGKLERIA